VEDEPVLALRLQQTLEAAGFAVDVAYDGEEGWHLGDTETYDAGVLDLGLPKIDGVSVLRRWRESGRTFPVLILTARSRWAEKMAGFQAGADDYMTKPFECSELVARLEALLRRRTPEPVEYAFGDTVVRPVAGQVLRAGQPVRLSAQELKLLTYFVRHAGVLLSRDQLLDAVWGYQATPETRTVDVHVSWLRQKLEPDPHHPQFIVTVFGLGYRFERPADAR
jgi:two-component system OmpR family response regulator